MDIDRLLKLADMFEQATKQYGYGLRDEPTASSDFKMWKVKGHDKAGNPLTANIYAHSEQEAKKNFVDIHKGSTVKEVELAKNLLK
jgi:hypothetical protein